MRAAGWAVVGALFAAACGGNGTDTDTDIDTDTDSETDTDTDSDTNSDSETDSGSDTDTDTDSESDTDSETETDSETDTDSGTDTDSETDTDTDSGTSGPMATVLVHTRRFPAKVMTADTSGEWLATYDVDALGDVTVQLPVGGYVTSAHDDLTLDPQTALNTIAAVQDGDELWMNIDIDWPTEGSASVSVADSAELGDHYTVRLPCEHLSLSPGSVPFTGSVTLAENCYTRSGELNALAIAEVSNAPVAYAHARNISVTGTVPNQTADIVLSTWNTNPGQLTATYTADLGVENGSVGIELGWGFRGDSGLLFSNDTLDVSLIADAAFHDQAAVWSGTYFTSSGMRLDQQHLQTIAIPADGTTTHVDLVSSDHPPSIHSADLDFAALSGSHGLTATPDCDGAPFTVSKLQATAYITDPSDYTHIWVMIAPFAGTISMPELDPALAAALWPTAWDESVLSLEMVSLPSTSYDTVRNYWSPMDVNILAWGVDPISDGRICVSSARLDE